MPSFKLHKFVSDKIVEAGMDYRTGVIYTTNRRVWEHDEGFKDRLRKLRVIGVDMETATVFTVGVANEIPRGALLLVSDLPMTPEGVKTERSDRSVTERFVDLHLDIGIKAMAEIGAKIPADIPWVLRVDGHTDVRPISGGVYKSNWDLSAARAIAVVKYLATKGIGPQHLVAAGFGEFQPIDTGTTDEAYRKNRRIEFKLTER